MIQFKYYNEGATFDASSLNNDDIAFVEDENALYTHGKKFKFVDEVTPSPTPTSKAQLARFILATYGADGEVQVLTDTYGRILTQYTEDGDYRTACVYVPGDSRIDWDTAGDTELVTLLSKYGYNDALTIENNNVTISDNGDTETLTWDSAAMDFTVDVEMFQNGAQNMLFRTVNDGSRDVTVLCDSDGKAIQADILGEYTNVLFTVANNGSEIDTITDDDTYSREGIINACGGAAVNVTVDYAGESVFLLVMGTHIQYCNGDDTTTTPVVKKRLTFEVYGSEDGDDVPTGLKSEVWLDIKDTITQNTTIAEGNAQVSIQRDPYGGMGYNWRNVDTNQYFMQVSQGTNFPVGVGRVLLTSSSSSGYDVTGWNNKF